MLSQTGKAWKLLQAVRDKSELMNQFRCLLVGPSGYILCFWLEDATMLMYREPEDCVSGLGWLGAIQLSFFCAFKLASRRVFLFWVKSLKEVLYKFFNESRRVAFPQRKVIVDDYQVVIL